MVLHWTRSGMVCLLSHSLHCPSPPHVQVSSFNWDHNDNFPQFSGCHALLPEGYMSVLSRLADGFDVQLDCVVKHVEVMRREGVDYTSVRVTDTRGNEAVADRVCGTCGLLCHGSLHVICMCR